MSTIKQLLNTYFNLKAMTGSTAQDYTLSIDAQHIKIGTDSAVGLKIRGYINSLTAEVLAELKAGVLDM